MAKVKKSFFCQHCGSQHPQWQGQCKGCKQWNTIVEEIIHKDPSKGWEKNSNSKIPKPIRMDEIDVRDVPRLKTGDDELDRVLGGGLVPGAVILLGGEPGIGKSTLLLQLALQLKKNVLYVSGEESQQQIKLRATRMGLAEDSCYVLSETQTQRIFTQLEKLSPQVLIIDSISTRSISQPTPTWEKEATA